MQRRAFITLLGGAAAAWPQAVLAQQTGKIPRIGVLWHAGSAEEEGPYFRGLIEGLRGLGYADGRNIILEHRFPNETPDGFRSIAAELVSLKVDVLIGVGSQLDELSGEIAILTARPSLKLSRFSIRHDCGNRDICQMCRRSRLSPAHKIHQPKPTAPYVKNATTTIPVIFIQP